MSAETAVPPPAYHDWLASRIAQRRPLYPDLPSPRQFSIVTPVWNTRAPLLQAAADSVLGQEGSDAIEWMLVDNGSTSTETIERIDRLARNPQVRIVRLPQNAGIFRAMRLGLENASGRYIVPMDSDDLLVPDCLRLLASAINAASDPAFVYSDEDLLIEDVPRLPYLRPDFDPVLNLASSFIWHLNAIRRDVALTCDLFTDSGADYCHDWDATMRIWQAGHELVHLREVLYHWRQHPESSTGKADPVSASIRSVRHVLERFVARLPHPERYRVDDFPIFRGARELYVFRNEFAAEPMDLLIAGCSAARVGACLDSILDSWHYPVRQIFVWSKEPLPEHDAHQFHAVLSSTATRLSLPTLPHLFQACPLPVALERVQSRYCAALAEGVVARSAATPWEALKHFELFADVGVVGGRVISTDGLVADAGAAWREDGSAHFVFAGLPAADPGHFAMALKPQLVDCPSLDAFFVRRDLLHAALPRLGEVSSCGELAVAIAHVSAVGGAKVAMTPLVDVSLQPGAAAQRESNDARAPWKSRPSPRRVSEMGFVEARGRYVP